MYSNSELKNREISFFSDPNFRGAPQTQGVFHYLYSYLYILLLYS